MQLNIDKTILGSSVRNSTYKALKTFDFKPSFQFPPRDRIMYGRLGVERRVGVVGGFEANISAHLNPKPSLAISRLLVHSL